MMRIFTVLTIFLLGTLKFSGYAQSFSIEKDTIEVHGSEADNKFTSYNNITNNSSKPIVLVWEITPNVPLNWEVEVCDNNTCYPVGTTSGEFLEIPAGESAYFQLYVYPNNTEGEGFVEVCIYEKGTDCNSGSTFIVSAESYSLSMADKTGPEFNMYPSPVKDYLNIKFKTRGTHEIIVYNILGRKVISKKVSNSNYMKLSFLELKSGMYVVMYRDELGRVATKNISKD